MRVDGHVTGRSAQALSLTVGNVLFTFISADPSAYSRLGIAVLFGHTKVDDMDGVSALGAWATDEEIVWLDISVDQVLFVNSLHPRQLLLDGPSGLTHHLPRCHAACFYAKLSTAHVEQILKRWSEQVNDENVVKTLLAKVVYLGDTDYG